MVAFAVRDALDEHLQQHLTETQAFTAGAIVKDAVCTALYALHHEDEPWGVEYMGRYLQLAHGGEPLPKLLPVAQKMQDEERARQEPRLEQRVRRERRGAGEGDVRAPMRGRSPRASPREEAGAPGTGPETTATDCPVPPDPWRRVPPV